MHRMVCYDANEPLQVPTMLHNFMALLPAENEDLTEEVQKLNQQLQGKEHITKENQQLKQQLQEKEQQIREKTDNILGEYRHCEASMI